MVSTRKDHGRGWVERNHFLKENHKRKVRPLCILMWDSGYRAGLDGEEEVRNQLCKKRLAELLGRPPETKQCNEWGTR